MKKLVLLAMVATVLTIINGCQKDEMVSQLADEQLQAAVKPDVYVEGDYLVFTTKEAFDSVRLKIQKIDFEECLKWEQSLNFISAKTKKYFAEEEALKITESDGIQDFIVKYREMFDINSDLDLSYKFYSKGLEDVLNIDGLVKIENSLYKFTATKELIILDGDSKKLIDVDTKLKSGSRQDESIVVFDPYLNASKLKSTDILREGVKTVDIRRLIYSLEKYVFSTIVNFDPYTGLANYKAGYELNLVMNQEKYTGFPFKKWKNNDATYNIENQYIDWNELGVAPTPGYTGWFQDDFIGSTTQTIKIHYISRQYLSHEPLYYDFALRSFTATFWSSGIFETNKITINI